MSLKFNPSACRPATALCIGALFAASCIAGEKAYTSADDAPSSIKIQGEYVGTIEYDDAPLRLGVQVVALGNQKFKFTVCPGGLPGAGFVGTDKLETEGILEEGKIKFGDDEKSGVWEKGKIACYLGDKSVGTLDRIERESETLGKAPPEGAVVLFDGTSTDAWKNASMTEDGLLNVGTTSKQKFGDHSVHLEFRTPYMPASRGQKRGNSGAYLLGRYEVQVLDSFGLEGKDNECGGIYKVSKPRMSMCFPPLTWQTYDIDFKAPRFDDAGMKTEDARITVRHNGVLIHNDIAVPKITQGGRGSEEVPTGPLYLQNHGNPVHYRNVWVVETPQG
ncbi:3-keto-disaccharide hydrolase [Stratiformator vulcanicus]|uniref:3-keto-alpha-glucoside-1,2-lyase/3-keto-2-hydroxy-glucal hydratase domain-containing protein n=1 Tax=Stratiformator vulcanicus TaxID=2527980 RepID=A0A517QY37_9PLAN|nr:DUF1080 domain-containing protein [Stratiformator vulcanicus]QDT36569.1 hypothetical protein Pan189_09290 [Stratiformator vulcanicus]